MRLCATLRTAAVLAVLNWSLCAQTAPPKETPGEGKGLPPRAAPSDYQAQAQVGGITLAADFRGHAVPTLTRPFSSEDYVTVEVGFFGPPEARTKIAADDFSLRINGKKNPLSAQPYGTVFSSLKDPEWVPPDTGEKKSKGGLSTGGEGGAAPPPPKMPFELQRAMQVEVKRAILPEGDRTLPQAGVLFFDYRGKTEKIKTIELIYSGSAGKATLNLQP